MLYKKINLVFDIAWLTGREDDEETVIDQFISCFKNCFVSDVVALEVTNSGCTLVIKTSDLAETLVNSRIMDVLKGKFGVESESSNIVSYTFEDIDSEVLEPKKEEEAPQSSEPAPKKAEAPQPAVQSAKTATALDKINALVGADEFKQLAEECARIAPQVVKYNTHESFAHRCYLFAINDGYGLSTYLEYFAELLSELGLFDFGFAASKVVETRLLPPAGKDGSGNDPFAAIISRLTNYGNNSGKVICIDISEWMTKTNDKQFRDFLSKVDDCNGQHIVVFRVPFVEKEILNGIRKNLGDQLFIRDVSFVPLDIDELTVCAKEALDQRGFTADEDVWKVFESRVAEEKRDGKFYGINTVNKIIREMIYYKQLSNAIAGIDNTDIKKDEILRLANSYDENERTGFEMLSDLVGMDSIRQRIEEIVAQIEVSAKNKTLGSPCIHMRFVGNPGTGKTTAARIIGKILRERGILRNGNFFEYSGRDFCGRYVGETAPKTAGMCRDAYGSVMFIDEAYSLYSGGGRSGADYGKEAIDTLIAEMENHRSDLVVIMAGYPDDMDTLMQANAGLESRMPFVIEFPNYTREQLFEIFMKLSEKSFSYDDAFRDAVKDYFDRIPDEFINAKDFSNARFVRNLFERTWGKAVLRNQMERSDTVVLSKEDFIAACSDGEFQESLNSRKNRLGFGE